MKSVIIFLIVFSTPFVFADTLFNEDWKVVKQVDGQWVEITDAKVQTNYVINIGNGFVKYEKLFTNNESDEMLVGFQQTITLDPTFGYDNSSYPIFPHEFIYMLIIFGLVAVVGTVVIIILDKPIPVKALHSFSNGGIRNNE